MVEPFLTSTAKLGTAFASMSIRALLTAGADQVAASLVGKGFVNLEIMITFFLSLKTLKSPKRLWKRILDDSKNQG